MWWNWSTTQRLVPRRFPVEFPFLFIYSPSLFVAHLKPGKAERCATRPCLLPRFLFPFLRTCCSKSPISRDKEARPGLTDTYKAPLATCAPLRHTIAHGGHRVVRAARGQPYIMAPSFLKDHMEVVGMWSLRRIGFVAFWCLIESALQVVGRLPPPPDPDILHSMRLIRSWMKRGLGRCGKGTACIAWLKVMYTVSWVS